MDKILKLIKLFPGTVRMGNIEENFPEKIMHHFYITYKKGHIHGNERGELEKR